jgi:hypothetical protein
MPHLLLTMASDPLALAFCFVCSFAAQSPGGTVVLLAVPVFYVLCCVERQAADLPERYFFVVLGLMQVGFGLVRVLCYGSIKPRTYGGY